MRIASPSQRLLAVSLAAALLTACGQAGELYLPPPKPRPNAAEKAQPAVVASPAEDEDEDEDAASRKTRPQSQDANR